MAVALFLRLFHLGHQSLWIDEIFSWRAASPHGPFDWGDFFINTHGPILAAMSHAWMVLASDSGWALRLPFALASIALVPAVAFLARRAAGDRTFLWAAWITALSPLVTWYGQEMRNYAFAFLWAALAYTATLAYRETGRTRDLALLALWSALGTLTNLNAMLMIPVTFGALVVSPPPGRRRVLPPLVALLGIGLVLLPWALHYLGLFEFHRLVPGREALPLEQPLRGATTFTWPAIPFTFFVFSVGYTLGPSLRALHENASFAVLRPHLLAIAATGIVFGVLALAGLWSLRRRRFVLALFLTSFLVPLATVTYFAVMNFKTFNPRYLSTALPIWFVLIAAGLAALPKPARWLFAGLALTLFVASLRNHYFDPQYEKDDFKSAAALLAREASPADSVVATGGYAPIEYYAPGRYRVYWLGYATDERMAPKFEGYLNRTGGATWVVVSRPEDFDPAGRFERWLRQAYRPRVTELPGVRVYRIAPGTVAAAPDTVR
jgi:mannosyltransferase